MTLVISCQRAYQKTFKACFWIYYWMQQDFFWSLSGMKTQKTNMQESNEKKIEEKVTEKGWAVLIFA